MPCLSVSAVLRLLLLDRGFVSLAALACLVTLFPLDRCFPLVTTRFFLRVSGFLADGDRERFRFLFFVVDDEEDKEDKEEEEEEREEEDE